jgi:hypothetical protein
VGRRPASSKKPPIKMSAAPPAMSSVDDEPVVGKAVGVAAAGATVAGATTGSDAVS